MAYLEWASKDFRVNALIGKFELGLQEFVIENGLDKPVGVRNLFATDSLARAAGAKEEEVDTWAAQHEVCRALLRRRVQSVCSCRRGGQLHAFR